MEYSIAAYSEKWWITWLTKTAGWITNDGFLESIIFAQCTVYSERWGNNVIIANHVVIGTKIGRFCCADTFYIFCKLLNVFFEVEELSSGFLRSWKHRFSLFKLFLQIPNCWKSKQKQLWSQMPIVFKKIYKTVIKPSNILNFIYSILGLPSRRCWKLFVTLRNQD